MNKLTKIFHDLVDISKFVFEIIKFSYLIVMSISSIIFYVVDTMHIALVYGPVFGIFWFLTIGPIVASIKAIFWPYFLF